MSENQARQEWHCLDPDCDWKLVETDGARPDLIAVPWQGSVNDTLTASIDATVSAAFALRETAMVSHIRDDHGASDPMAWAEEKVREVRAVESGPEVAK